MDKDGYPTPEELESIKSWPSGYGPTGSNAHRDLMSYIEERWRWADAGYWTEDVAECSGNLDLDGKTYSISTGGWSGNESIIAAMQGNHMFWMTCWWSSRHGGHYEFEVKL
jgi:hypothetical protein